ncbi:MAG: glyoxalase [Chloroflexi bacterium]|nr:glyoxalase [Chloroflexota bacterium]MYC55880.1 glyoxalase [Chloroflexota bacterium]MYI41651.1 glyoxalase [Chloroflexota bacterium]
MMNARLQHVSIPRPPGSEAATREFYGGLLGMQEIPPPKSLQADEVIWFRAGEDAELHVFLEAPLDDRSNRHLCLVVDDLLGLRERLLTAGYQPYAVTPIPGRPRFFCRDPFGNILEFTTIEGDYRQLQAGGA